MRSLGLASKVELLQCFLYDGHMWIATVAQIDLLAGQQAQQMRD